MAAGTIPSYDASRAETVETFFDALAMQPCQGCGEPMGRDTKYYVVIQGEERNGRVIHTTCADRCPEGAWLFGKAYYRGDVAPAEHVGMAG